MKEGQTLRIDILRRRRGNYWRATALNSEIVAVGGEPFTRPVDARRAARELLEPKFKLIFDVEPK